MIIRLILYENMNIERKALKIRFLMPTTYFYSITTAYVVSDEIDAEVSDIKTELPIDTDDIDDTDDEVIAPVSSPSMDEVGFKLLGNGKGDFKILVKGEAIDVPNDEIYTSIALDKSLKAADRAEKIYDEMKTYGDI
jgi:hypothetical protein